MYNSEMIKKASSEILEIAQIAKNEEQLKIGIESVLKELCIFYGIGWNPYTYEYKLNSKNRKIDAIHGSIIIEYEFPRSFNKQDSLKLRHAKLQAEEYSELLSEEEGRYIEQYTLVVWDGETICFGYNRDNVFIWEKYQDFSKISLIRLMDLISNSGKPLVSPLLLKETIGPETDVGKALLPVLYKSVIKAKESCLTTKTKLIYTEWARLFGQVDGADTDRISKYLHTASKLHNTKYEYDPQSYLFALNTYIALIAKLCAVYALTETHNDENKNIDNIKDYLLNIEKGNVFKNYGIENLITTDFFSWYLEDDVVDDLSEPLKLLIEKLNTIDFNVTIKKPQSIRDLFKGLYMKFTPAPMRHALGEYYTPDWLAAHVVEKAGWKITDSLLDPTCGSGTFCLEAIKRRVENLSDKIDAVAILKGIYGFDLNPLAVLTTKASIVVYLSNYFNKYKPIELPIYLADAINTADPENNLFTHIIPTEKGDVAFSIPLKLAESDDFFHVMDLLRINIDMEIDLETIIESLSTSFKVFKELSNSELEIFKNTVQELIKLHKNHWNGIWCLILYDRIKAGCVKNIDLVTGNPPWVKWSNLPRPYAEFIKPICDRMKIFSEDSWVGGIQSDISTVITYHALERFVNDNGSLAFLITGTVFKNESSQGFRRWELCQNNSIEPMTVELVEEYSELRPFEGAVNTPALLLIRKNNRPTKYPVLYRIYKKSFSKNKLENFVNCVAVPVPGTDCGPWLIGKEEQINIWSKLFRTQGTAVYKARKGVTTDLNGVYFVETGKDYPGDLIEITNDPNNGKNKNLIKKTDIIEKEDVFPLLRGRDIKRFVAKPQNSKCVIVPQRGMSGDPSLPITRPKTFRYLSFFKPILEKRSSYLRFQKGKPFWSIWSTGEYSFSPYKVVWKEMSGNGFVAAYISNYMLNDIYKTIVPDHKVYFIPVDTEQEAAYLTAFINSKIVSDAIGAYASALSLGTSITDYINIPKYSPDNDIMNHLSLLAMKFNQGAIPTDAEEDMLDLYVKALLKI